MRPRFSSPAPALVFCVIILLLLTACSGPDDPLEAFRQGDYQRARVLWAKQAARGDTQAQARLGMLSFLGLGGPKDYAMAYHWYAKAAIAGNADAQRYLGYLYQEGLGVRADRLLAWGWYYQAASQGQEMAQNALDMMSGQLTPNETMKARAEIRTILEHQGPGQ